MNFRTTLILLVVLLGLGAYVFFTSRSEPQKAKTETEAEKKEAGRKLFDVKPQEMTKITVAPADGKKIVLQKEGANWKLLEPVTAPAETLEVDSLARALAELTSHGRVTDTSESSSATGLANPRYKVEFSTNTNKTYLLSVGEKSAVGNNLYVQTSDSKQPDVVGADLLEKLEKPANSYRNPKLVNLTTGDVTQVTIDRPEGTVALQKVGTDWRVMQPAQMPADSNEVDDLLFAVTGLRATEWVAEDQKDARQYQLDHPRYTVTLATTRPSASATTQASTQAAATQPVVATIKIGRYEDVLKKNVLVTSSDTPAVAKVAASIVDTISKKPIELRDKRVLQVDSAQVSGIAILSDIAATTQPTTKPAEKKEAILRRHQVTLPVGVAAPTTGPSTTPATQVASAATKPSTQPATTQAATQPAHKWEILGGGNEAKPADDSKVDDLLFALNPLRAEKYLETSATTQPTATYTLKITTQAAGGAAPQQHTITVVDPGSGKNPIGTFEDLRFEVSRSLVDKLSTDYAKSASSGASTPPNPAFPESR